jgi:uncharacterized membrane protein YbhN (UPF0104 family)
MAQAESSTPAHPRHARAGVAARHAWWPRARRGLTLLFFAAVAVLLVRFGSQVQWREVWTTVLDKPLPALAGAAVLAALSHALVASYDLIGRRATGHALSVPRVLSVAWVAYVFNLNLGALVGGVGFRLRLYSQLGLDKATIAQVYAWSVLTNWYGYMVLLGATLLMSPATIPADWHLGPRATATIGALLLSTALAYLLACWFAPRRQWQWRGHGFTLPSGRMALVQLCVSSLHWLVVASVISLLLGDKIVFPDVLAAMLLAAVAGAVSHVPAGLGVLEAVFIALLGHAMPTNDILAALLTYRAIYYLAPLALGLLVFSVMESRRRQRHGAPKAPSPNMRQQHKQSRADASGTTL